MQASQKVVTINDQEQVVIEPGVSSLAELVSKFTLDNNVAVAIDSKIIPHRLWGSTLLFGDEQLTIFGAIAGG